MMSITEQVLRFSRPVQKHHLVVVVVVVELHYAQGELVNEVKSRS